MQLTSVERIIKTLKLEEPDRVPTCEINIDKKVREAILPGASYEDFIEYMNIDAAVYYDWAYDKYETINENKGIIRDKFGVIKRKTGEIDPIPLKAAINSEKDLRNYIPPDPDVPWKYDPLKKAISIFKGKRAVIATVVDVFYIVNEIRGMVDHFIDIIMNPEFIDKINEIVLNYNLRFITNCINIGVDIIWITGDFAYNAGPMVSPEHLQRFAINPLKRQVDCCIQHGVPCLKHTDGNILSIMDSLIETGISGIHPIDPGAGMDISEVKRIYGDRICLIGNIDCGDLLTRKTEQEVREAVKNCINNAGVGGGLICASSNSIHSGVLPNNYVAMLEAIKYYGRYPISGKDTHLT
jgi:uroporphyrinogen decarboxylase